MLKLCLAISNIAWKPSEREAIYAVMAEHGVMGLEIAPARTFADEADPFEPSSNALSRFRREVERRNLELVSMQSLLFGVADAYLFGSHAQRERFEGWLKRAVVLAGRLGISNLVLGSPSNRAIPASMDREEADRTACDVFRRIGDLSLNANVKIALEPNAAAYGTNFLNSIDETAAFAHKIGHPAISVNFDLGSLHMNNEIVDAAEHFARAAALVSHVHISEPNLAPAPRDVKQFEAVARAILGRGYSGWFSIEMRDREKENRASVKAAIAACSHALEAAKRG